MHPSSKLNINQLKLNVFLGWPKDEREQIQTVVLDLELVFPKLPTACQSDELDDTYCYAKIIAELRHYLYDKRYRLLEHLTNDIFNWLKRQYPNNTFIRLSITKFPGIKELGGVTFTLESET